MAGLTDNGFVVRRLDEIYSTLQTAAQVIFQDLVPEDEIVETGPNSTIGRMVGVASPEYADLWEALEDCYNSFDPNSATGVALENIVSLAGLTRKQATKTSAPVLCYGDNGVVISPSSIVASTSSGKNYVTSSSVFLNTSKASGIGVSVAVVADSTSYNIIYTTSSGNVTIAINSGVGATATSILADLKTEIDTNYSTEFVTSYNSGNNILYLEKVDPFSTSDFSTTANLGVSKCIKLATFLCEETGPFSETQDVVTSIKTPVLGWDTARNPVAATIGNDRETDEELRERFLTSKAVIGSGTVDAIFSAISSVEDVSDVVVLENDTTVTDINGLPAHSIMAIVIGGSSTQIAQAIYNNKSAGISTIGNTTVVLTDSQGFAKNINLERPANTNVYITVNVHPLVGFPSDGEQQIKDAIKAFFDDLKIGDDVIYSRLYTPINSVPGHQVNSLTIGTSPAPVGTSNITIDFNKKAFIQDSFIVVNIV